MPRAERLGGASTTMNSVSGRCTPLSAQVMPRTRNPAPGEQHARTVDGMRCPPASARTPPHPRRAGSRLAPAVSGDGAFTPVADRPAVVHFVHQIRTFRPRKYGSGAQRGRPVWTWCPKSGVRRRPRPVRVSRRSRPVAGMRCPGTGPSRRRPRPVAGRALCAPHPYFSTAKVRIWCTKWETGTDLVHKVGATAATAGPAEVRRTAARPGCGGSGRRWRGMPGSGVAGRLPGRPGGPGGVVGAVDPRRVSGV
jgi:hypothetical protein